MTRGWVVVSSVCFFMQAAVFCGEATTVTEAVALFRNNSKAPADDLKQKAMREFQALSLLLRSGNAGVAAVQAELKKLKESKERDDQFELAAAAILAESGGTKHVVEVAEIWNRVPLDLNYPFVFYPAFEASATKDSKYLPMLAATLRDRKSEIELEGGHPSRLEWPATHTFIWGPMGRAGIPTLREVLKTSGNETARISAALQLTAVQDLDSLPHIREIVRTGSDFARTKALEMLGQFGHPDDYGLLTDGLKSASNEIIIGAIYGLRAYGDLRAVPLIANSYNTTQDPTIQNAAVGALMLLIDAKSVATIRALKLSAGALEKDRSDFLEGFAMMTGMKLEAYDVLTSAEQDIVCAKLRVTDPFDIIGKPEKRELTRDIFLEALKEWMPKRTTLGFKYSWVRAPRIYAVLSADDIDPLIDLRSAILCQPYGALLAEADDVGLWIRHAGRKRYRAEPEICNEVKGK